MLITRPNRAAYFGYRVATPFIACNGPPGWHSAQDLPDGAFLDQRASADSARITAGLLVGSRLSPKPVGFGRVSGLRSGLLSGGSGPFCVCRNATTWTMSSGVNTPAAPHGG